MDILFFVIQILPVLILLFSFYKIEYSILLFICYNVLVPLDGFTLWGIHFGNNFLFLILFVSFVFKYGIGKINVLYPFIVLYSLLLLFMMFEYRMDIEEQLNRFRQEVMSVFILPLIIYISYCKNVINLSSLKNAILLSAIISSVYAFFLSFVPYGVNPYLIFLEQKTYFVYAIDYSYDINRGIARIFSTMANPQSWALYLGFILYFTLFLVKKGILRNCLLVLIGYNILFCGVRTVVVAAALPLLYYIFRTLKVKTIIYVLCSLVAIGWFISTNSDLYDYFSSFVGSKRSTTVGSDMEMRWYQLEGCFDEISSNPIWGNGFRWTAYYNDTFGNHPKSVTFESLIFVILTCWGYAGFVVWGIFFFLLLKRNKSLPVSMSLPLNIVFFYYIIFSLITGEYLYIIRFTLYYIIFYIFLLDKEKRNNPNYAIQKSYRN